MPLHTVPAYPPYRLTQDREAVSSAVKGISHHTLWLFVRIHFYLFLASVYHLNIKIKLIGSKIKSFLRDHVNGLEGWCNGLLKIQLHHHIKLYPNNIIKIKYYIFSII